MQIKFTGPALVNRTVGKHTWSRANRHVVNVEDPALAADLLTSRSKDFALSTTEPLLQWLTEDQVLIFLVEFNLSTVQEFIDLPKEKVTAEKLKLSVKALREIQTAMTSFLKSNDPITAAEEIPAVVVKSG